jgi:putative hydroxymethylpyrimidine transporter CytX
MRWLRQPEAWGADPVPPEKRRLRAVDLGVLWFSLGVGLLVLFAGALLVLLYGLSLFEVLLVSVAGSVIGSLMLAAAALPGARHGVPTMVSLRPVLGARASWIPSGLNAFQLLGWASLELMIMGLGLSIVTGPVLGPATTYVWIAVLAVWVGLLALGGPLVVIRTWLERVAVWLVIGSTAWLTYAVLSDPAFPAAFFAPQTAGERPLGLALDLVIAMPISWWPLVADYNRFAARPAGSFAGTFIGYTLSNSWFFFLGAAVLVVFGLADPGLGPVTFLEAIVGTVLGALVLLVIIVDETDNAFANVYSTAVSAQNVAPRARQRTLVIGVAAASFLAGSVLASAWASFAPLYEGFLLFIGGVFVPLLGVMVADQVVRRTYGAEEYAGGAPAVRPTAIVAWGFGVAVYVAIAGVGLSGTGVMWLGPLLTSPVGASLPAFGVAGLVHGAGSRLAVRVRRGRRSPT